jgi:TRAP-type C4-dicarboxylate transport system permease small subunit
MTSTTVRITLERSGGAVIAIAILLTALLFLAGLAVIYYGDEIASPAWSEQSIPPPRAY